jgi:hypothetical protein
MKEQVSLIRWDEAMQLLEATKNVLSLNQLVNYANFIVLGHFNKNQREELPVDDFDLYFFLKTVRDFSVDQSFLKTVLDSGDLSSFREQMHQVEISRKLSPVYFRFGERRFYQALIEDFRGYIDRVLINQITADEQTELTIGVVRLREATSFLLDEEFDPITATLIHYAHYLAWNNFLFGYVWEHKMLSFWHPPPAAGFDLYFFMRVMLRFCSDHLFLRKVLNGEDLRWFPDEDDQRDHLLT